MPTEEDGTMKYLGKMALAIAMLLFWPAIYLGVFYAFFRFYRAMLG